MVKRTRRAFTFIEILAVLAIVAALTAIGIYFVASYLAESKQVAKKQVLFVLNDALTRYKTQGGTTRGLTVGASIGRVLRQLRTPVDWVGQTHQFLDGAITYPARSLQAVGNLATYRFYGYDGYIGETLAADTPTSENQLGFGVGSITFSGSSGIGLKITCSGTSYWAIQVGSADPLIYSSAATAPIVGAYATFWACAGAADSTKSGVITKVECPGPSSSSRGNVTALDVRNLTAMVTLNCYYNYITSIKLPTSTTALKTINCIHNSLTTIDISGCTELTNLSTGGNNLSSLDVSKNTKLLSLLCSLNNLSTLDLSQNTKLVEVECSNNSLTSLDVSHNPLLTRLLYSGNAVGNVDLSAQSGLLRLECASTGATALDVSGNTGLLHLVCHQNLLSSIDLSNNTALQTLSIYSNSLSSLDVSNCTLLQYLYCQSNPMTTLDISNNPALVILMVHTWSNTGTFTSITFPATMANISYMRAFGNPSLVGSASAINNLFGLLSDANGGVVSTIYIGAGAATTGVDDTVATSKGWTVSRTNGP